MTEFKVVPDVLREREPLVRGRIPRNPLSKALLEGQTVFITGKNQTWGSLYTLAKNHNKQCKTKRTVINNQAGTLAWFEERRVAEQITVDDAIESKRQEVFDYHMALGAQYPDCVQFGCTVHPWVL